MPVAIGLGVFVCAGAEVAAWGEGATWLAAWLEATGWGAVVCVERLLCNHTTT